LKSDLDDIICDAFRNNNFEIEFDGTTWIIILGSKSGYYGAKNKYTLLEGVFELAHGMVKLTHLLRKTTILIDKIVKQQIKMIETSSKKGNINL